MPTVNEPADPMKISSFPCHNHVMQSPEPFDYEARYGAAKATRWPVVALVVAILESVG
jgi:hypothetical protein